jgi:hypothetical protein
MWRRIVGAHGCAPWRPQAVAVLRIGLALAAILCAFAAIEPAAAQSDPVFVGAGDIAWCSNDDDEATADLLDGIAGTVYTLGDNVYEFGTATEFTDCYDPTWGRHKARTMPSPGNHDYYTPGASGYYGYFGAAAGDPTTGYYSYDLGAWHIIVINSNCLAVSCAAGSPQDQWLRTDLVSNPATCTLAYWHHPRFSSGFHGSDAALQPIWQALYDFGADVVLSGHDHSYERFAPQTPSGVADPVRGIREFIVGTGGRSHYAIATPIANSEANDDETFGVLKLTLHPTSYDWDFIPIAGFAYTDSGSAPCVSLSVGGVAATPEVASPTDSGDDTNIWTIAIAVIGATAAFVLTGAAAYALLRSRP